MENPFLHLVLFEKNHFLAGNGFLPFFLRELRGFYKRITVPQYSQVILSIPRSTT